MPYSAIVLALTLYAIFTPYDFSIKGGTVIVILMTIIMLCVFTFGLEFPLLSVLISCIWVIMFGVYLLIDTQMIVGGKRMELSIDDYVLGVLLLYMDIMSIFLCLIQMFKRK